MVLDLPRSVAVPSDSLRIVCISATTVWATASGSNTCCLRLATAQNELRKARPTSTTNSGQQGGEAPSIACAVPSKADIDSRLEPSRACFSACFTARSCAMVASLVALAFAKEGLGLRLRRAWSWFREYWSVTRPSHAASSALLSPGEKGWRVARKDLGSVVAAMAESGSSMGIGEA